MKCPVDSETLVMTDRKGVEIDYCPKCRGVWLDRGELDKIIDRSVEASSGGPHPEPRPEYRPHEHHERDYPPYPHHGHGHKRRKSFLSEIFDFD